jgi:hypothetical protein
MRYKRFTIKNFKGIESLVLDLEKPPIHNVFTLVGLNESGKTSILHAINWFHDQDFGDPYELIPKASRANFNGELIVEAEIGLSKEDHAEIRTFFEGKGYIVQTDISSFIIRRGFRYKNSLKESYLHNWTFFPIVRKKQARTWQKLGGKDPMWQSIVKYIQDKMLPPIIFYENFLFDFPDEIYLTKLTSLREFEQHTYRMVLQDVLDSLLLGIHIDEHLVARFNRGTTNDLDGIQAVLDQASAKITEAVVLAWRDIIKKPIKDLAISLGAGLHRDDEGIFVRLKVKEGNQTYYIRERSLGFRWFLGFILFTHFRTYRDNQRRNALFLLDEPASNLHPAAQRKILSVFDSFPANQNVIYSTHSHYMIRPDWLGGTFVVYNEGRTYNDLDLSFTANATKIGATRYFTYVASHPHDTDLYRPILDAVAYEPGPLEFVPDIVVVEGKNDYYTLRYFVEVLLETSQLFIYPSTGKDKTEGIMALYLAWGRNFVVLLDADKGGKETVARLRKSYGPVTDDKVFTLADVDSSWERFSLEDLFSREDRITVQKLAFPEENSYSKSLFNSALQQAFLTHSKVKISSEAERRAKSLVDFLLKALARESTG